MTQLKTGHMHARNQHTTYLMGASDLDSMMASTFSHNGPEVIPMDCDYTMADCLNALFETTWQSFTRTGDSEVVPRGDLMTCYYGPTRRIAGDWDTFVGTRSGDMVYWDPFSPDDGWPGYDDGTSYVSPIMPLNTVGGFCALWMGAEPTLDVAMGYTVEMR